MVKILQKPWKGKFTLFFFNKTISDATVLSCLHHKAWVVRDICHVLMEIGTKIWENNAELLREKSTKL